MFDLFKRKAKQAAVASHEAPPPVDNRAVLERRQKFGYHLSGPSYRQSELLKLATLQDDELDATLYRDIHNEYDPNAVAIRAGGMVAGFLHRDDAATFVKWMDEEGLSPSTQFKVAIQVTNEHWEGHGNIWVAGLGVKLSPPRIARGP